MRVLMVLPSLEKAGMEAMAVDLSIAVEQKAHTRLGSRLNYETTGLSSLFRGTGLPSEDVVVVGGAVAH